MGWIHQARCNRSIEPRGTIVADPACRGCFKAVFTNLNAYEIQVAIAPENRNEAGAWVAEIPNGAEFDALGLTIYGIGEVGGPGMTACPAAPGASTVPVNRGPGCV